MKDLKIINKSLNNISKDLKMDTVKGIVLHANPKLFNKSIDEVYNILNKDAKEEENRGLHYLVEGEKIYRLIPDKYISRSIAEDSPTTITKSLFGDTVNEQLISIGIVVNEVTDYAKTELTLVKLIVKLMKDNSIYPNDVWRSFDLDKTSKGPFHILSKGIFEKYIKELVKYVPNPDYNSNQVPEDIDEDTEYSKKENTEECVIDSISSPYSEDASKAKLTVTQYVTKLYHDNLSVIDAYVSRFQPWDKDRKDARVITTLEGETQTKETIHGNTLLYKITEEAAINTDHCVQAVDFLEGIYTPAETMVEPIYPDLITPPGDNIHIADGFSETAVQSDSNTPLTAEELEKRQKIFDFSQFSNMKKETKGRPVNVEDPFPVDDQIKKLEEHYPKVKVDKITFNFKDTNHPNSEIGNAMAKNYSMCYDMVTEIAKRTEQRLVKLENNLSTVMRNLFRISSRVNINCVYYGGQSVYGKYKCIRCLHDDRINDGAIVTIDQCMSCTRYEPILGQVYAILDETGSNIVQVMDDLQMSYMELEDYKNLTSVNNYHEEVPYAKVDQFSDDVPKSFMEDKWKDTEEEQKLKKEQFKAVQETTKASKEKDAVEEDSIDKSTDESDKEISNKEVVIANGFKMDWNPVKLETQEPHVNIYDEEKLKAEKKAVSSETEGVKREIYVDTREEAIESERLEFNIDDYEISDFGNNISGSYYTGISSGYDTQTRNKIIEYVKNAIQLCSEGKAKYSQELRYNHLEKAIKGINYWDCSSLVQRAYESAGISGIGTNTKTIFPYCLDKAGGMLIPLANESEALPGDIIWFTNQNPKPNGSREELQNTTISLIPHIGIYMGDGKYGHSSYAHADSTKDIVIADISSNKKAFCFARPKALIERDSQFGQGLSGNAHWSREFHGITDEWWDKAKVVDGQVQLFVKNMEKWGYKKSLIEISQQKGFDPYLTAAIITVESTGDPRDNDRYAGLMQVQGHYGTTELAGMRDNISKGLDMILAKKTYLKQKGWSEDNIHVLISAYNSGEGTVGRASTNINLATCKIPELGDALYKQVKAKNPGWNAVEKQTYGVKILRAYNLIYSNNYLGLPQDSMSSNEQIAGYENEFIRPLDKKYKVSSEYGPRTHPVTGEKGKMHHGVDFAAPNGVSIKASKSGKVILAKSLRGYGNVVYLDHGNGITTRYAHMSRFSCKAGDNVKQGQEIGKVGNTGVGTGPHLHFEIRIGGNSINPLNKVPR